MDDTGRIVLTDAIRDHCGITDSVAFMGRRHFFQIWEPSRFELHRAQMRARVLERRQAARQAMS